MYWSMTFYVAKQAYMHDLKHNTYLTKIVVIFDGGMLQITSGLAHISNNLRETQQAHDSIYVKHTGLR